MQAIKAIDLTKSLRLIALALMLSTPLSVIAQAGHGVVGTNKARLEDYRLLALSPSEEVAVFRDPEGKLVTIRVGAMLAAASARLVQVMSDRVRFEAEDEKGAPQTAWMMRSTLPERASEVQRINAIAPAEPIAVGYSQPSAVSSSTKKK